MSTPHSRQRSPEDQAMSRSASMFNQHQQQQQQQQQSFFPMFQSQNSGMSQMHQLSQQQQAQIQQNHNQFNLSPPLPVQSNFGQYQQQLGMMDLNQVNQHLSDFSLMNHQSSPPPQEIDPNFLLNNQTQNQTMNPQNVIGSNYTSPTMQNIAIQSTAPDWSTENFQDFRGHTRALSDYSDVSPHRSPNLVNQDYGEQPSPLLVAAADQGTMMSLLQQQDNFGLDQFNLNDHSNGISPHHSPHISPHLTPQHTGNGGLGLMPIPQLQMFQPPPDYYEFGPTDMRPDDGMHIKQELDRLMVDPPLIEVDFAPPQRQPTFPGKLVDVLALSPPARNKNQRQRSASDPPLLTVSNPSRPATPEPPQHSQSYTAGERRGSLHPNDLLATGPTVPSHGSASPGRGHARRSSTSALPNRDYILDLAAPTRPGSNATDSKRVQKHPATFQCHLCPKRFTRAYNLRSHLRTHTDERPFVCTVCGKAFARQHDRKRHEGLHSGEKKFVCRGDLKTGGHWGCGRRFARADALGRHFRSEAGRVCIKPLLDEEAIERMANQQTDLNNTYGSNNTSGHGTDAFGNPMGGYPVLHQLPMALIAQYPALASAWEGLAQSGGMDEEDDSRRNSFDVSGSEFEDMGSARNSFDGSAYSGSRAGDEWSGDERGWTSDTGEIYGNQTVHGGPG